MEIDSTEEGSPAQQLVAWAWLGAYAGMLAMSCAGFYAHEWFGFPEPGQKWACGTAVSVAFLILYRGCVASDWPRWLRVPWLLLVACGLFIWMVSFFMCMFLGIALSMRQ